MPVEIDRAVISADGKYRYLLTRKWASNHESACFIMLNPSTADAENDDPTIRRCIRFAQRLGVGQLRVVNLFAYRATKPRALLLEVDPVGPENNAYIAAAVQDSHYVIAAWGARWCDYRSRAAEVVQMIDRYDAGLLCFGLTRTGCPRHPLYLPSDANLMRYEG